MEALITKYIDFTDSVLKEIHRTESEVTIDAVDVDEVLNYVTAYLEDAKYYKAQGRFETSLTSVAYCEGLLDALRLLGAVEFKWPARVQRKR